MPRPLIAAALTALLLGCSAPALASSAVKTYANCTAVNAAYPGGIAKRGVEYDVVRSHGAVSHAPLPDGLKISTPLYAANRKSDRDHDGIACEHH